MVSLMIFHSWQMNKPERAIKSRARDAGAHLRRMFRPGTILPCEYGKKKKAVFAFSDRARPSNAIIPVK
jgi:hypothetical protein